MPYLPYRNDILAGTAAGFLAQAKKIGMTVPMPEGVKNAAASIARNINKVLNSVGAEPSSTLDFYGHPFSHPLVKTYFKLVSDRLRRPCRETRRVSDRR